MRTESVKLTILTSSVQKSLWSLKSLIMLLWKSMNKDLYGGHYAVTRSLVQGLKELKFGFNYNPNCLKELADTVLVLSDLDALRQMIRLKRIGRINKILAGPNLVVIPSDDRELIAAPEIDTYLVNSKWTLQAYIDDEPLLSRNCISWAAGVDTQYWKPASLMTLDKKILLYHKNAPQDLCDFCVLKVSELGYIPDIIRYSEYDFELYLKKLHSCDAVIFLSQSESQGIALAEAWSTDLPTLVWNPGSITYNNKVIESSSAPYLTSQTGMFFKGRSDFEQAFLSLIKTKEQFSPRKWVLENMSDRLCATNLLRIAGFL